MSPRACRARGQRLDRLRHGRGVRVGVLATRPMRPDAGVERLRGGRHCGGGVPAAASPGWRVAAVASVSRESPRRCWRTRDVYLRARQVAAADADAPRSLARRVPPAPRDAVSDGRASSWPRVGRPQLRGASSRAPPPARRRARSSRPGRGWRRRRRRPNRARRRRRRRRPLPTCAPTVVVVRGRRSSSTPPPCGAARPTNLGEERVITQKSGA